MRTTISIDDELMGELMKAEPDTTRSEAVRRAVQGHLRQKRMDDFMRLAGSQLVDLDWREMERIESDDAARTPRTRDGRKG